MYMLDIKEGIKLGQYTTFNIGGTAQYFVEINNEEQLRESLDFARHKQLPFFVFSGGSNLLFSDDIFNGLIIRIVSKDIKAYKDKIIIDAGVKLIDAISFGIDNNLTGMENMYGIPGSVGGAVRGNAGAFGTEIKDVLYKARALNIQTGEVRDFNNKECQFDYRSSFFKINPQWLVLNAVFKLDKVTNSQKIKDKCIEILTERKKRHIQDVSCAGSFFKNPIGNEETFKKFEEDKKVESRGGKVPAGWLIDKCELKGTQVGGAQCSPQQANYIVNTGNATQGDVLKLRDIIKSKVKDKFNIELEEEVIIIK